MKKQKLVVISVDSLIYDDLEYLKTLPNFKFLFENGSVVNHVKTIYPSITYPCHTTMITGCYPDKHKITNNFSILEGSKTFFDYKHRNPECKDIFTACKQAGYTTAAIGWPVTGNHPDIDYLVPECWPEPEANSTPADYEKVFLSLGTSKELFDEAIMPFLDMRPGREQPESTYFLTLISAEIIKKHQPDVLFQHHGNIDTYRHDFGVFAPEVTRGLDETDRVLGMLITACKQAGTFEETNFIVTSDHGHLNCCRDSFLLSLLAEGGFVEADENYKVVSQSVYAESMGMCAKIWLKEYSEELYNKVYNFLLQKKQEGTCGIESVYTKEEFKKFHLDGNFDFVIESDSITHFSTRMGKNIINNYNPVVIKGKPMYVRGMHGYHPDKAPRPPFIAFGPKIKKGVTIEHANLVDGAPTYAKILGVELNDCDGKSLNELLN